MKKSEEYFRGCLIGGAIGDALGWPVEFLRYDAIKGKFGEKGIEDLVCNASGVAEITDDTQMMLFTAEGILRAESRGVQRGISHPPSVVYYAYHRWLITQQGYEKIKEYDWIYDGWLLGVKELFVERAPGRTCLSALKSQKQGTTGEPINNSKGCGGVMRVAPAGLFYAGEGAFNAGADMAALTHGHPSGYLSAGVLTQMIASIILGRDIDSALKVAMAELETRDGHEECTVILKQAIELSQSDLSDIEAITKLGEGWVGEEALAISVYCALKYRDDFKKALIASVNHNGDSDSTGAITGNILGAYLGISSIPAEWVEKVELRNVVLRVADDLLTQYEDTNEWRKRYPGY